ncbi:EF-hand domain-containing protein [Cohaesibacter gelatinilyticus]|uniref:Ca2+-binding protein, EF-hand superfamily n=1 Tax=Cohaesibacter gelatinilyticus TaxID=372072 RepID=A0A285N8R6_9HYPH|nr:hypothetical protein [Cohaesibacter gelatinilyticus]SNZ05800.1 Ca2+-binding protein, EF-hand superfamily [Cohaesibacter gelatinilyticus]
MKSVTKIALALALITGVSATALTANNALARGFGGGDCGGKQEQGWHGNKGGHKGGFMGKRGGSRGPMKMLKEFDTNKDQALTKEEITAGIDKKIADNDKNGDKAITLEEFQAEWQKQTQDRMVRAFQRMDRDGSGTVTAEELKEPALSMFDRMDRNDDGKLDKNDRGQKRGWFGKRGPNGQGGNAQADSGNS